MTTISQPSRKKTALEEISLSGITPGRKGPILHFDTFGTLPNVLRDIEANVPHIFDDSGGILSSSIKNAVRLYAEKNNWALVALRMSKGLARYELDDIIKNGITHTGTIVVDPTGSTVEHQTYQQETEIQSARERLVRVNEATGDILVIIYGIEEIDRPVLMELAMRKLRIIGASLDLLAEENSEEFAATLLRNKLVAEGQRLIKAALDTLGFIILGAEGAEVRGLVDPDGNRLVSQLLTVFALIHTLNNQSINDPSVQLTLSSMMVNIAEMNNVLRQVGISFEPYEEGVLALREMRLASARQLEINAQPQAVNVDNNEQLVHHPRSPSMQPR